MSDALDKIKREDLNAVASALGVENADQLDNKGDVADAILAQGGDEASQARIAELEAKIEALESGADEPEREPQRRLITVRQSTGEWWCPFCESPGGSNGSMERRCGTVGCNAIRDGEEAVRA